MYYPWFEDENFTRKIVSKKEMNENRLTNTSDRCLTNYQYAVSNFINPNSPYSSILLYHSVGTGKTTSSISIAENFIRKDPLKKIIVITKNKNLIDGFKSDLLSRCSRYSETNKPKNYSFITHDSIKSKPVDLTNKVVIVDEVHNLLGNTGYTSLMNMIKKSKNYKLVLLSATPAYDNISDFFELSNILNGKFNQYNTSSLVNDGYIENIKTDFGLLYKNTISNLTKKGETSLLKSLHGKISYLKQDINDFPTVTFPNSKKIINGKRLSLGVIVCKMEEHQNNRYIRVANDTSDINLIEGTLEMLSSIIYPDVNDKYVFGQSGMDYFIKSNRSTSFLKEENIKKYSTKLYNLLLNIKKSPGKIYIYSRNITNDGIPLIKAFLSANGYSKILTITSDTVSQSISPKIDKFNSTENDNGSVYQILLSSSIITEGITLKSIRQVHIYEPSWNYSSTDQIIGRAVRKKSHSRLQPRDRNVEIFLYCAISSNINKSVDLAKYVLSSTKDNVIKKFERLVAMDSFTCSLFKSQNIKKGVDGSRECEYSQCEYSCNYENSNQPVDTSTYNIFLHNKELYNEISSKILNIFEKTNVISLDDLVIKIGYTKDIIQNVMKNSPVKIDYFGNIYALSQTKNTLKFGKIKQTLEANPQDIIKFTNNSGKLSITVKNSTKLCLSGYKSQELKDIVSKLGLVVPNKATKEILCDILEDYRKKLPLVV